MTNKFDDNPFFGVVLAVAVPIVLLSLVFVVTTIIGWIAPGVFGEIMGSEDCVISWDYSYIEYFDEKYIPFDSDEYIFHDGDVLVEEARVQFAPVLGKLFFGDTVYSVVEFPDKEVIRLQTDHDGLESEYYVKTSEYDAVLEKLALAKE